MSDTRDVAARILRTALHNVTSTRGTQHGNAHDSFTMIAELWSTHINHATFVATGLPPSPPIHLTSWDVAQMMSMVKKGRAVYGERSYDDHYVDDAGYTSLAGMLAGMFTTTEQPEDHSEGNSEGGKPETPVEIPSFLRQPKEQQ